MVGKTQTEEMVRAYILKDEKNSHRVFVRRDKFKHIFELGKHKQTDNMFYSSIREGSVVWDAKVKETNVLF